MNRLMAVILVLSGLARLANGIRYDWMVTWGGTPSHDFFWKSGFARLQGVLGNEGIDG